MLTNLYSSTLTINKFIAYLNPVRGWLVNVKLGLVTNDPKIKNVLRVSLITNFYSTKKPNTAYARHTKYFNG